MNYRNTLGGLAAVMLAARVFSASAADSGEVLSNANIIDLTRAGVTQDLILSKIQSSANTFDMSTRGMITLKENGVSDELIRAMLAAAQSPAARPTLDRARFARELENVAGGTPDAGNSGIAWIVANREQAIPALRQSLSDARPEIRSAALAVFARLNDRDSLPAIRNLLTDQVPDVRAAAARTLAELDDASSVAAAEQAVARQLNPMDGYARLLGHARVTQAAGTLGHVVSSNSPAINRIAAIWALGEIGRAGVAGRPALENALLSDSDPEIRREAAAAIAKFHDAASAKLLQDACRTDPEVRKITLSAMAEYPEAVEFLVGVINLGPDQIAADELESARNSLHRLTGQDFGMDGQRWADWFSQNRTRFDAANVSPFPGGQTPGAGAPQIPGTPDGAAETKTSPHSQVDLEAWSIVADSSAIPMAPIPMPSPVGGGSPPMFVNPGDFDDTPATANQSGGMDPRQPAFRTWSSEPGYSPPPSRESSARNSATNRFDSFGSIPDPGTGGSLTGRPGDSSHGAFGPAVLPESDDSEQFGDPGYFTNRLPISPIAPSAASATPVPPVAAPEPAISRATADRPPAPSAPPPSPPSGISLPLPGMMTPPPSPGQSESPFTHESPTAPSAFDAPPDFAGPQDPYAQPGFDAPPSFDTPPSFDAPPDMFASPLDGAPVARDAADGFPTTPVTPPTGPSAHSPFGDESWDSFSDTAPGATTTPAIPAAPHDPGATTGGESFYGSLRPPATATFGEETFDSGAADDAPALPPTESASIFDPGIFVEPAPGQEVIGPPLFGPGSAETPFDDDIAREALPVAEEQPDAMATASPSDPPAELVVTPPFDGAPARIATPPTADAASSTPPLPRPAAVSTTTVDPRFITPGTDVPVVEEEQPRRRGLFGRRQAREKERHPAPTGDLPRDYVVTPQAARPESQFQQEAGTGEDYFTDPSAPLPPVRSGGLITAPPGHEQPPTLGEGLF